MVRKTRVDKIENFGSDNTRCVLGRKGQNLCMQQHKGGALSHGLEHFLGPLSACPADSSLETK